MIGCTIIASAAQLLFKYGTQQFDVSLLTGILWIATGIVLYGMGAVLMIYAFKQGEVTVLYPIVTLSYVWVGISSMFIFNEQVQLLEWIGILFVIIGISTIGTATEGAIAP